MSEFEKRPEEAIKAEIVFEALLQYAYRLDAQWDEETSREWYVLAEKLTGHSALPLTETNKILKDFLIAHGAQEADLTDDKLKFIAMPTADIKPIVDEDKKIFIDELMKNIKKKEDKSN